MAAKKKTRDKKASSPAPVVEPLSQLLRWPAGTTDLAELDTTATPGFPGRGKADAPALTSALAPELADLQERLYAAGRVDPKAAPRALLILQGMDTSGKSGVIKHAIGLVDPQGVKIKAFRPP
ncbi:MAG: polyphosphate kinase 2 family protein, partial [Actinomycetes bacterium]